MGIEDVVTALRSPWQNPYVERVIGSIGRECLNRRFCDGCVTFGQSHGRLAIHISAMEDRADPELGPD